jgi:hypothetical protein
VGFRALRIPCRTACFNENKVDIHNVRFEACAFNTAASVTPKLARRHFEDACKLLKMVRRGGLVLQPLIENT